MLKKYVHHSMMVLCTAVTIGCNAVPNNSSISTDSDSSSASPPSTRTALKDGDSFVLSSHYTEKTSTMSTSALEEPEDIEKDLSSKTIKIYDLAKLLGESSPTPLLIALHEQTTIHSSDATHQDLLNPDKNYHESHAVASTDVKKFLQEVWDEYKGGKADEGANIKDFLDHFNALDISFNDYYELFVESGLSVGTFVSFIEKIDQINHLNVQEFFTFLAQWKVTMKEFLDALSAANVTTDQFLNTLEKNKHTFAELSGFISSVKKDIDGFYSEPKKEILENAIQSMASQFTNEQNLKTQSFRTQQVGVLLAAAGLVLNILKDDESTLDTSIAILNPEKPNPANYTSGSSDYSGKVSIRFCDNSFGKCGSPGSFYPVNYSVWILNGSRCAATYIPGDGGKMWIPSLTVRSQKNRKDIGYSINMTGVFDAPWNGGGNKLVSNLYIKAPMKFAGISVGTSTGYISLATGPANDCYHANRKW